MRPRKDYTFFEEPKIKESSEAERFIEDYGVDGEKLRLSNTPYNYHPKEKGYATRGVLRLFCKDCPDVKCQGRNWDTCKYRMHLLTVINKELAKQNKGLKEDVANYKEILGEKQD